MRLYRQKMKEDPEKYFYYKMKEAERKRRRKPNQQWETDYLHHRDGGTTCDENK